MPDNPTPPSRGPQRSATQLVLREARRLHRAATSADASDALPVLRRILAARAMPGGTLPHLFRLRHSVQRKHLLRMLAVEAGYDSWNAYGQALPLLDPQALQHASDADRGAARLKLWFRSLAEAERHAALHGGRAVPVRNQAVVVPASVATDAAEGEPT